MFLYLVWQKSHRLNILVIEILFTWIFSEETFFGINPWNTFLQSRLYPFVTTISEGRTFPLCLLISFWIPEPAAFKSDADMTPASRFRLIDALLTNTSNPFQNKELVIVSRSRDIWNKKLMGHIKVMTNL